VPNRDVDNYQYVASAAILARHEFVRNFDKELVDVRFGSQAVISPQFFRPVEVADQ